MLESRIEAATNAAAKKAGGRSFKWTSPGHPGVPDRIVFLPGGRIIFVELKAPGKKPTPLQVKVHQLLRSLGADVRVVDSMEAVNALFV